LGRASGSEEYDPLSGKPCCFSYGVVKVAEFGAGQVLRPNEAAVVTVRITVRSAAGRPARQDAFDRVGHAHVEG
jgi:hypothetical protein